MKKTNVFLLMFLACAMSFSQVTTSAIKGSVSDETNSELPGANVIAVHNPTGLLMVQLQTSTVNLI